MYHNHGKAINKHVEAERRTSPAARVQVAVPSVSDRMFQSKVHKSKDAARRWLWRNLVLKRHPICTRNPDSAA
jgi:hypothetical protein